MDFYVKKILSWIFEALREIGVRLTENLRWYMKTARNSVKYQASFSAFFKKLAILFEMADYMISIFYQHRNIDFVYGWIRSLVIFYKIFGTKFGSSSKVVYGLFFLLFDFSSIVILRYFIFSNDTSNFLRTISYQKGIRKWKTVFEYSMQMDI